VKVGDLIRVYDPDERFPVTYSALGIVTGIKYKTIVPDSYRIFNIYTDEGHVTFDEPYWEAEIINSV